MEPDSEQHPEQEGQICAMNSILTELRIEIAELTEAIVRLRHLMNWNGTDEYKEELEALLKRRSELSIEIARVKVAQGLEIRDYPREEEVRLRIEDLAKRIGMKVSDATSITNDLMAKSAEVQTAWLSENHPNI